jgi:DNA-binding helix-hairpin-helix protein with protein kinase domain
LRTSNSQGSLKRIIKRGPLANAKVTIETLPSIRAQRMAELGARCRQKQLQRFLESHRIEDAVLPNIGKGRKQLLRVYNIEDASDVEPSRINGIKGFGPTNAKHIASMARFD